MTFPVHTYLLFDGANFFKILCSIFGNDSFCIQYIYFQIGQVVSEKKIIKFFPLVAMETRILLRIEI